MPGPNDAVVCLREGNFDHIPSTVDSEVEAHCGRARKDTVPPARHQIHGDGVEPERASQIVPSWEPEERVQRRDQSMRAIAAGPTARTIVEVGQQGAILPVECHGVLHPTPKIYVQVPARLVAPGGNAGGPDQIWLQAIMGLCERLDT